MDKIIKKKKTSARKIIIFSSIGVIIVIILYSIFFLERRSMVNINLNGINISEVKYGIFQEYVSLLGNITPSQYRYLDATQSGIIKKIHKKSGEIVEKGDELVILSNSTLELNVITQESAIYFQLSTIRNLKLQLNQNNLNQLTQLANFNYQLNLLEPQHLRYKSLFEKNLVSKWEYAQVYEQYEMYKKQKDLFLTTFHYDSVSRASQLEQIQMSEQRMLESLVSVRQMLDELIIKAPIDGQLTAPDLQIGQSIASGQRLGQIEILNKFNVRANVDEHYLADVKTGQKASFEFNNKTYELVVSKVFPNVSGGTFLVEMDFINSIPNEIKSGQNLQIRLELGNSKKGLLLPVGSFYSGTGGNWVYVVNKDKNTAEKRNIKLGRKNPVYFEVLEGLKEGDQAVTSSYELFGNKDVLILK